MICYAKIQSYDSQIEIYNLFLNYGAEPDDIVLDTSNTTKKYNSVFQELKRFLLEKTDVLIINSIGSLGKNGREIVKELVWFKENNIPIIILDIPSTLQETAPAMDTLVEIYSYIASVEIRNVKTNQQIGFEKARSESKPLGRKRIPYPENWDKYYSLWKQKKISITEFMESTNLKKGTLYNLIKQYQEQEDIAKEA